MTQGHLILLSLKDELGNKADQLDITLFNSDGLLIFPAKKYCSIWLGFKEVSCNENPFNQPTQLIFKCSFTIDEVSYGNLSSIDTLRVTERSADYKDSEKSWYNYCCKT